MYDLTVNVQELHAYAVRATIPDEESTTVPRQEGLQHNEVEGHVAFVSAHFSFRLHGRHVLSGCSIARHESFRLLPIALQNPPAVVPSGPGG